MSLLRKALREIQADASALFAHLSRGQNPRIFLESQELESGRQLESLAMLRAALAFSCRGSRVKISALTPQGASLLPRLSEALAAHTFQGNPTFTLQPHGQVLLADLSPFPPPAEERQRLTAPSTLDVLRSALRLAGTEAQIFGGFAFDYLESFEALPEVAEGENSFPDYLFYLAEEVMVVDHGPGQVDLRVHYWDFEGEAAAAARLEELAQDLDQVVTGQVKAANLEASGTRVSDSTAPGVAGGAQLQAQALVTEAEFSNWVRDLQENIDAGDIFQVVPSRGFSLPCPDAWAAYLELRRRNPSPYLYYLQAADFEAFGASPESALRVRGGQVAIRPIAGTRPRAWLPASQGGGYDLEEDTRQEVSLRTDPKEMAEHLMLVDLARNDLARVCVPGSRQVTQLAVIEKYSRVMHLVSQVEGTLAADLDALDAYRACMNMGTLSGAPKLRATELIRRVEGRRRGLYGGALGYLHASGEFDTCIVIRSALVTRGRAIVQAGAGVVRDSSPAAEAAETRHKARAVLEAIAAAQGATLAWTASEAEGGK